MHEPDQGAVAYIPGGGLIFQIGQVERRVVGSLADTLVVLFVGALDASPRVLPAVEQVDVVRASAPPGATGPLPPRSLRSTGRPHR